MTRPQWGRVAVPAAPMPGSDGLGYECEGTRTLLPWAEVEHVFAAEVGEPEGVRTIVFDLLTPEDDGFRVLRLDAEPGEEAMHLARAIQQRSGPSCQSASLKSVATDGIPSRWFPDLRSFEEDALSEVEG